MPLHDAELAHVEHVVEILKSYAVGLARRRRPRFRVAPDHGGWQVCRVDVLLRVVGVAGSSRRCESSGAVQRVHPRKVGGAELAW
jgi:hypothetical protein